MGQSSSHSCVVCDQGAGPWAPVDVTFSCSPISPVLGPLLVHSRNLSSLTHACVSTCLHQSLAQPLHVSLQESSPTCLCKSVTSCLSSAHFLIYPFTYISPCSPQCLPVLCVSPSFLNTCEPEHMWLPCLAAVWGALGYLQDLLLSEHLETSRYPNLSLRSNT